MIEYVLLGVSAGLAAVIIVDLYRRVLRCRIVD